MGPVRIALYAAALLALATLLRAGDVRSALATSASALFEAAPFLLAGIVAARFLRHPHAVAYLGCGCAAGPSARSLPAAAATWLLFGPLVAVARFAAALVVARLFRRDSRRSGCRTCGRIGSANLPRCFPRRSSPALQRRSPPQSILQSFRRCSAPRQARCWALRQRPAGSARLRWPVPCALQAPIAAAAFLCVAGIVDLRALTPRTRAENGHDALALHAARRRIRNRRVTARRCARPSRVRAPSGGLRRRGAALRDRVPARAERGAAMRAGLDVDRRA